MEDAAVDAEIESRPKSSNHVVLQGKDVDAGLLGQMDISKQKDGDGNTDDDGSFENEKDDPKGSEQGHRGSNVVELPSSDCDHSKEPTRTNRNKKKNGNLTRRTTLRQKLEDPTKSSVNSTHNRPKTNSNVPGISIINEQNRQGHVIIRTFHRVQRNVRNARNRTRRKRATIQSQQKKRT